MSENKDNQYSFLENNANAVRAVMSAVDNTIGPKGLDTMLVDQFGQVVITNDGVTILREMAVSHPVAKMLINAVKAQQEAVGDGTTTVALMAGELILSGIEQMLRGVPAAQVIAGIRAGITAAHQAMARSAQPVTAEDRDALYQIALIAGREHADIAQLITEGVALIGRDKLLEEGFKLSDMVKAVEGADNEVFSGVLVEKERADRQMPLAVHDDVHILVLDDALEPERLEDEALATESGFKHYLALRQTFKEQLQKIIITGARVVFVDRGLDDLALETLSEAGIMVVSRVPHKTLEAIAEHTGARMIKRSTLEKPPAELAKVLGRAEAVVGDEKRQQIKVIGGAGKPMATVLVGASTGEIVGERERIAKDAAASVQAAVQYGLVVGGGAGELAIARELEDVKNDLPPMAAFGVDCVMNALRQPFWHIAANAGFNPLEKLSEINKAQITAKSAHLGLDCDSGEVADLFERGIVDPAYVKLHGLTVAGEVAEAVLRIHIIVKKKEYQPTEASS